MKVRYPRSGDGMAAERRAMNPFTDTVINLVAGSAGKRALFALSFNALKE